MLLVAVVLGLVLALGILAVLAATGVATSARAPERPAPPVGPVPSGVVYEVSGDAARALVSYGRNGAASRDNGVGLPWSSASPAGEDGDRYSLTVQSSAAVAGLITCRILVDGEVIAEETSSARYSAVACVGTPDRS